MCEQKGVYLQLKILARFGFVTWSPKNRTTIKTFMTEDNTLLTTIIEGIQERKGKDIAIVDLSTMEYATAQCFVICSGTSTMHVSSVADCIQEYVEKHTGVKPYASDGYQNSQWIVIDYGTIYVHVFMPESRELYNLEQLWNDAAITLVPNLD